MVRDGNKLTPNILFLLTHARWTICSTWPMRPIAEKSEDNSHSSPKWYIPWETPSSSLLANSQRIIVLIILFTQSLTYYKNKYILRNPERPRHQHKLTNQNPQDWHKQEQLVPWQLIPLLRMPGCRARHQHWWTALPHDHVVKSTTLHALPKDDWSQRKSPRRKGPTPRKTTASTQCSPNKHRKEYILPVARR